jgi:hypothetical protein
MRIAPKPSSAMRVVTACGPPTSLSSASDAVLSLIDTMCRSSSPTVSVIGRSFAAPRSGLHPGAKSFGSIVTFCSSDSVPVSTRRNTASAIGNLYTLPIGKCSVLRIERRLPDSR